MFTKFCQIFKSYIENAKKNPQLKATFYSKKILSTKPEVVQCKKNLVEWKRKCEAKICSQKLVDTTRESGSNFAFERHLIEKKEYGW